MSREYDIVLFGVTGFTGRLAAEHLLLKAYPVKWAACARNESKAAAVLQDLGEKVGKSSALPKVEVCDLVCATEADEARLRAVVRRAKCVITTAGPFEKYGQTLVKVCAEEGVHYADIAGESDFFRLMIERHDGTAHRTGAKIVVHCGNDCIPWDLTVFEMSKYAQSKGAELVEASTFTEMHASAALSGGSLTTAVYQLGKKRVAGKPDFDPLLRTRQGSKSESLTKIASPKREQYVPEFKCRGGPWIMGPVMANCVRRSNALLGYSPNLLYGEMMLRCNSTWGHYFGEKAYTALVGAAVMMPSVFQRFLPGPGEGPTRETMDAGWLNVYATGKIVDKKSGQSTLLKSKFHFDGDTTYLNTARMLVESAMVLLTKEGPGGVTTPAAAMGSDIVQRLETELGAKLELCED